MECIRSLIAQAIARGYTTEENKNKELDSVLIEAMVEEVMKLILSFGPMNYQAYTTKVD